MDHSTLGSRFLFATRLKELKKGMKIYDTWEETIGARAAIIIVLNKKPFRKTYLFFDCELFIWPFGTSALSVKSRKLESVVAFFVKFLEFE